MVYRRPAADGAPGSARNSGKHYFDFLIESRTIYSLGSVLEEKVAAVFLLEGLDAQFRDREFRMFEQSLDHVSSWADHDGLVHCSDCARDSCETEASPVCFSLGKSAKRWQRRGACVALIRGIVPNVLSRDRETV